MINSNLWTCSFKCKNSSIFLSYIKGSYLVHWVNNSVIVNKNKNYCICGTINWNILVVSIYIYKFSGFSMKGNSISVVKFVVVTQGYINTSELIELSTIKRRYFVQRNYVSMLWFSLLYTCLVPHRDEPHVSWNYWVASAMISMCFI